MDYKELVKALRCDGNNIGQDSGGCTNKKCRYRDPDSACNIVSICEDAASAITDLLVENQSLRNAANGFKARVKAAEARAEKAERERNEAVKICAKLIALCSPPKEWVPKLFRRHINRPGDYMGCGYTFLDGFNLIIENFVETADDELYTAIRGATEKEIIERSMRMSGKKEE